MTAEPEERTAQLPLPGGLSFQSGTGYLLGKVGAVAKQRWTATLAQLRSHEIASVDVLQRIPPKEPALM